MILDRRFAETFYAIEATTFEVMSLLDRWDDKYKCVQDCRGVSVQVGSVLAWPVNISCQWYTIHDRLIMFWEPVSSMVWHELIDEWLEEHCPCPRSNAMNFRNCILEIERKSKG